MNLLKSLAAVSSITMISRVLGFVRDTLLARIFGASMATDAFFIAFKLPNLLRRIFAEGAFSQAFVPILAESRAQAEARCGADPQAALAEITARLEALRSPFRTAEAFGVEEIIDPRQTRPLLCEFAEHAYRLLRPLPTRVQFRP